MKWTPALAKKLFGLLPEAKALAMDEDLEAFWYVDTPKIGDDSWYGKIYQGHYLGKFECDNWKESLFLRNDS